MFLAYLQLLSSHTFISFPPYPNSKIMAFMLFEDRVFINLHGS